MKIDRTLMLSLAVGSAFVACTAEAKCVPYQKIPSQATTSTNATPETNSVPVADIWEFQKIEGERVGLVVRYATPDDEVLGTKLFSNRMLGPTKMALLGIQNVDGTFVAWGDPQKSIAFWKDLQDQVSGVYGNIANHPQDNPVANAPAPAKPISVQHPNLFVTTVDVSSDAVHGSSGIACIIYHVYPNQVTAAGCVGTAGLVMFDELGGNEGVRYVGTGFLGFGPGMVVPKNPKKFGENVVKTAINQFKQAKLYENTLRPIVAALPEGKKTVALFKQAIKPVGDLKILGTTPSHALASWQSDPVKAAQKTVASIGDTPLGGHTTIGHAAHTWTTDPGAALGKTLGLW